MATGKAVWKLHLKDKESITALKGTPEIPLVTFFGAVDVPLNMIDKIVTFIWYRGPAFERPKNPVIETAISSSGLEYKTVNGLLPEPVWLP